MPAPGAVVRRGHRLWLVIPAAFKEEQNFKDDGPRGASRAAALIDIDICKEYSLSSAS